MPTLDDLRDMPGLLATAVPLRPSDLAEIEARARRRRERRRRALAVGCVLVVMTAAVVAGAARTGGRHRTLGAVVSIDQRPATSNEPMVPTTVRGNVPFVDLQIVPIAGPPGARASVLAFGDGFVAFDSPSDVQRMWTGTAGGVWTEVGVPDALRGKLVTDVHDLGSEAVVAVQALIDGGFERQILTGPDLGDLAVAPVSARFDQPPATLADAPPTGGGIEVVTHLDSYVVTPDGITAVGWVLGDLQVSKLPADVRALLTDLTSNTALQVLNERVVVTHGTQVVLDRPMAALGFTAEEIGYLSEPFAQRRQTVVWSASFDHPLAQVAATGLPRGVAFGDWTVAGPAGDLVAWTTMTTGTAMWTSTNGGRRWDPIDWPADRQVMSAPVAVGGRWLSLATTSAPRRVVEMVSDDRGAHWTETDLASLAPDASPASQITVVADDVLGAFVRISTAPDGGTAGRSTLLHSFDGTNWAPLDISTVVADERVIADLQINSSGALLIARPGTPGAADSTDYWLVRSAAAAGSPQPVHDRGSDDAARWCGFGGSHRAQERAPIHRRGAAGRPKDHRFRHVRVRDERVALLRRRVGSVLCAATRGANRAPGHRWIRADERPTVDAGIRHRAMRQLSWTTVSIDPNRSPSSASAMTRVSASVSYPAHSMTN